MKSHWITHNGVQVWYSDYSDFGTDFTALAAEMAESDAAVCQQPENSVIVLIDVRGTVGSREVVQVFKDSSQGTNDIIRQGAVLGISGIRKLLLDGVNLFTRQQYRGFGDDEMDVALDWLVQG